MPAIWSGGTPAPRGKAQQEALDQWNRDKINKANPFWVPALEMPRAPHAPFSPFTPQWYKDLQPVPWFSAGGKINYTGSPAPMLPAQNMIPAQSRGYDFPAAWYDQYPQFGSGPGASAAPTPPSGSAGPGLRSAGTAGALRGVSGTATRAGTASSATLTGQPPVSGSGPYGEIPSVPNPLDSASTATDYAQGQLPTLKNLVGGMFPNLDKTIAQINSWLGGQGPTPASVSGDVIARNQANQPATQNFIGGIEPTIPATWDVIKANLGGQVTRPEINAMTQWGQERGVGGGFGTGSPATNTAIQAALGNTAYQREQLGVQQGQQFGQHLYGMQRPFMVTPGEEAGAQQDILKTGVAAAEALGRDVFNAISQFLPTHGDVQGAQYAANVARAAPNPAQAAAEAQRLQEIAALREYQLALAAQERGRRSAGQPNVPSAGGGGGRPVTFSFPGGPAQTPTPIGGTPTPRFGPTPGGGPGTPGAPEGWGEGTGEAYPSGYQYDPVSGMFYDPVFGGYYDVASGEWFDEPFAPQFPGQMDYETIPGFEGI